MSEQPPTKQRKVEDAKVSKEAFLAVFENLAKDVLDDEFVKRQPEYAQKWISFMQSYNVPKGKLNRGMAVLDGLLTIKPDLTEAEVEEANILGWCIEWLQAFFLVADDLMDDSVTRRGQPCWYKRKEVGTVACNDSIFLEASIYRILKKHFRTKPYYVQLLDLFLETTFQTSTGQLLDLITAPPGVVDLSKYEMKTYNTIVEFKTAYYSFYLPLACGMVLGGVDKEEAFESCKEICVEMGTYFQAQDDYLDCFGDPEVIGKIGTDIEDNKCGWLICKGLEKMNEAQKKTIQENYGKKDPSCVAKIKAVYREIDVEKDFKEYENESYKRLQELIERQTFVPAGLYMKLLKKIYKRQK
ncbi:farnesyl diphosphate synthase [Chloropicon primus]|nr:farnesyl diphosphate synthase [Chloropicon primus]UPQ98920.1 farnesyl diphosphate synthase [Chloropicon primus]|eukprot:QDZ19709.1 farnesyl diphosphate synthase [Chloropicon primus]